MQGKKKIFVVLVVIFLLSLGFSSYCAYPEKPVEVIVAWSPGGGTDVAARLVAKYAEKYFGQNFAIINKTGAAGEIGFTAIAQSKPDGYTIGWINPPTTLLHPIQREGCKYTLEDFAPIANIVMDPGVIAVREDSKFNSLEDFLKVAKEKKKGVSIGYCGPGTADAMTLRKFETIEGVEFNKIPFEGTAPIVAALLGGHVDAACMNISEAYNHVLEGRMKLIGVGSPKRSEMLPDVSTFKEQGYDVIQASLRGIAAPAGFPEEYRKILEEAISKTMRDPEFLKKVSEMQMPLQFMGSEEYTAFLKAMDEDLSKEWAIDPW